MLQLHQRGFQVIQRDIEFWRQEFGDLFQRLRQIGVIVQRIDQQADNLLVALFQRAEIDLFQQMVAQAGLVCSHLAKADIVVVTVGGCAKGGNGPVGIVGCCFAFSCAMLTAACAASGGIALRITIGVRLGGVVFFAFQERIFVEQAFRFLIDFQRRQLQ